MESFKNVLNFDMKYDVILSNINARAAHAESERLKIEKENQAIRNKNDQIINLLLGFIGIGQVIFAVIQLLGASSLLGEHVAHSSSLRIISLCFSCAFICMIVYVIVFTIKHKKTKQHMK